MGPCETVTDTLAPVERTNWALSAWNSTLDQNDVPSAWLYGQDHLWAAGHLVSSPSAWLYGQDHLWAAGHLVSSPGEVFPPPSPPPPTPPHPPLLPPTHPPPHNTGLKLMHTFEKIV